MPNPGAIIVSVVSTSEASPVIWMRPPLVPTLLIAFLTPGRGERQTAVGVMVSVVGRTLTVAVAFEVPKLSETESWSTIEAPMPSAAPAEGAATPVRGSTTLKLPSTNILFEPSRAAVTLAASSVTRGPETCDQVTVGTPPAGSWTKLPTIGSTDAEVSLMAKLKPASAIGEAPVDGPTVTQVMACGATSPGHGVSWLTMAFP